MLQDVSLHKQSCPRRWIICGFCHLIVECGEPSRTAKDLYAAIPLGMHESECGSRTITCIKCTKQVQLKEMGIHVQFHDFERKNQKIFKICANINCSNPCPDTENEMKMCAMCYSPFWSPRDDPGMTKMAQKLAHVYHTQLTTGCGRETCLNKVYINFKTVLCIDKRRRGTSTN